MRSKEHGVIGEDPALSNISDEDYHAVVDDWLMSNQVCLDLDAEVLRVWRIFGSTENEAQFSLKELVREFIAMRTEADSCWDQPTTELMRLAAALRECHGLLMDAIRHQALITRDDEFRRFPPQVLTYEESETLTDSEKNA